MKTPLLSASQFRRETGSRAHQQRGVTMILVALSMVAIIAMAALSIDVVTLYLAREEAQRAADAGALAGARLISISGVTGDPNNASGSWQSICGGTSSPASLLAAAVAQQSTVGSIAPTTTVTYSAAGSTAGDCSTLPSTSTGVNNPIVNVQVSRGSLPTFFSRMWGRTGNTVNASASAEVYNPSNSGVSGNGQVGTIVPVQPRCVKPWIIPNQDPLNPAPSDPSKANTYCSGVGGCKRFIDRQTGEIINPGISTGGGNPTSGVIGEQFWLQPDCIHTGGICRLRSNSAPAYTANPPYANYTGTPYPSYMNVPPTLQYLPGAAPSSAPQAIPSCSSARPYEEAVAGCDTTTVYQCGVQYTASASPNQVDLSENPSSGSNDVRNGMMCLIHQTNENQIPSSGQDSIDITSFPFKITSGSGNPILGGALAGNLISSSPSIVSLPIYDSDGNTSAGSGGIVNSTGATSITIIGFLQVFVNAVDNWGNVQVVVLNVSGCSNGSGTNPVGAAVNGTSPVPVRLITPP